MDTHPPTERGTAAPSRPAVPWRGVLTIVGCLLVITVMAILLRRPPPPIDARSPSVLPQPAGVSISFETGQWAGAVIEINGTYTCNIGQLDAGNHLIAWNRFQGPASVPVTAAMVRKITLRGDVDGQQKAIDFTVSQGQGFTAVSSVEEIQEPSEGP